MDRTVVVAVLLLVGLTWLLYKITAMLAPRNDQPANAAEGDVHSDPTSANAGVSRQKPVHQRLRQ